MKVCIDQTRCETAGICVQLCPQIFRFEPGSNKAVAVTPEVPREYESRCRDAAHRCPVQAICLTE